MVEPALQSVIEAMSLDERMQLVEFIENSDNHSAIDLTEDQKAMIESRVGELGADPSLGLTWGELDARLGSRWA
jgi:putative addiction module component (TIGR02574 family)